MLITYIGHSAFRIEKDGYRIIIDPYKSGMIPGLDDIDEEAELVIKSHDHDDHNAVENVHLTEGAECPFEITSIETYHDECHGAKRGKNRITIISDGNTRLAHFGDLGCDIERELEEGELSKLRNLDVALIPIGGKYTIDGAGAVALMNAIEPKMVIPMHFRSDKHGFGLDDIATRRSFTAFLPSVIEHKKSTIDTDDELLAVVNVLRPQNASR